KREVFQPLTGEERTRADARADEGHDLTLVDPGIDPIAVAASPDGKVVLLSRAPARLYLWPGAGAIPAQPPLELDFEPHDMVSGQVLLRGSESALRVLVSDATGNQLRAFRIESEGGDHLAETAESFPL